MSKLANLQNALDSSTGKAKPAPVAMAVAAAMPEAEVSALRQSNRAGQVNISAWMNKDFKRSLRLLQAKRDNATLQDLMAEALNDLFSKYDVPTVSQESQ